MITLHYINSNLLVLRLSGVMVAAVPIPRRRVSGGVHKGHDEILGTFYRDIAQLVARQFWELDAASSSLVIPTTYELSEHLPYR